AGVSSDSGRTTCASQTFSNSDLGCISLSSGIEPRSDRDGPSGALRAVRQNGLVPAPSILGRAVDETEEHRLQLLRDRPALAGADLDAIDRADGRDLRGRAGQKHLVREVEQLARDVLLDDLVT